MVIADLLPNCIRKIEIALSAARRIEVGELHQFLGVSHREHAEDDRVDKGEDGGVGADAEGESEDGDGSEGGILAQGAQGVADVLEQRFEERDAAGVATFFFGGFEAAKFEAGAAEGFVPRDAGGDEVVGVGFEMEAEFGVHVALHLGAVESGVEPGTEAGEVGHYSYLRATMGSTCMARRAGI